MPGYEQFRMYLYVYGLIHKCSLSYLPSNWYLLSNEVRNMLCTMINFGYGRMHRSEYNLTSAMYNNTHRRFLSFLLTWSHSPAKICPFHHLWSSCHLRPFYSQFPVNGGIVVIFCYGAPMRLLFVII